LIIIIDYSIFCVVTVRVSFFQSDDSLSPFYKEAATSFWVNFDDKKKDDARKKK